jgi:hypothetical protein
LNLHSVEVSEIQRGMVLAPPSAFKPTFMLDCDFRLLPSASPIEMRKRIRFHLGTAELIGHVVVLGRERLEAGESAFVQIRLEAPTIAVSGDRFIIRQYSPMTTIGGGEVLDPSPKKHPRMDSTVLQRLRKLQNAQIPDRVRLFEEERRPKIEPQTPPPELSAGELVMRSAIESKFRKLGLTAPRPDDVLDQLKLERSAGRKLTRLLVNDKVLIKINDDLVLHRDAAQNLIQAVRALKEKNPLLGVAEFKALTGVSRKYAIPLLEFLDRQRVTQRVGNDRTIL